MLGRQGVKLDMAEFNQFMKHMSAMEKQGFSAMIDTMLNDAEDGLDTMKEECARRTKERSGRLVDSYSLGHKDNVFDVRRKEIGGSGSTDVVIGTATFYAKMVNNGHRVVAPSQRKDHRRDKRSAKGRAKYDSVEGRHFHEPAIEKIKEDFFNHMQQDFNLLCVDTSFDQKKKKRKKRKTK